MRNTDTPVNGKRYRKNYDAIDWHKDEDAVKIKIITSDNKDVTIHKVGVCKECQCANPVVVDNIGAIGDRGFLICQCGRKIHYDVDYWKKHNIKQPLQEKQK